ncbi:MAG: ABC transporter ATP-binding protein [Opitutales bacterium]|nr:ABC transporter ATP-binding protein [Opitutales bacterium]MCH8541540.1 ABC transporter ATP-binding protein [Opitutales bacterium]
MNALLEISQLAKKFADGKYTAVNFIDLEVEEGEIFALLGPSGCGKTTTLRMIAGFERADHGEIRLQGNLVESRQKTVPAEKRNVGIVFQDYALFPHLTVLKNVAFGLKGKTRREREQRAREVLALVGLEGNLDSSPSTLSGGQQQRVALARTLVTEPNLILMDEPFSSLDPVLRESTRAEVRALLHRARMTTILVTHDQEEALSFADRVAVMKDGRIEQVGTPEEVYNHPETEFVARFLGRTNLINGQASGCMAETPLGRLRLDRTAWGKVQISLRPEHLTLVPSDPRAKRPAGEIVGRAFKGHDITYRIRFPAHEWIVHTDNRTHFQIGDKALLSALEPAVVLQDEGPPEEA